MHSLKRLTLKVKPSTLDTFYGDSISKFIWQKYEIQDIENWAPKAVAFKFPNWEQLTHSQKPRAPTFYLGNCPYGSHRGISPVFIFHFYFLRTDSFIRSATKNGFSEDLARRGKRKNCSFFRRKKYSKIILIFYRLYTLLFLWNYSFSQCIKQ